MAADISVLLIAYHFHPSNEIGARRVTKLARFLASHGIKVLVVSQFDGANLALGSEIFPGVIAVPVPQPATLLMHRLVEAKRKLGGSAAAPAQSAAGRAATESATTPPARLGFKAALKQAFFRCAFFIDPYKRWALHASRAAVRMAGNYRPRLIISSSPPHSMHLAGWWTARKLGIPYIADFRDAWVDFHPDFDAPHGSLDLKLTTAVERKLVRDAAAITCTAPSLIERLIKRHGLSPAKLHLVRNGFDGAIATIPVRTNHRLSVLYAGEIYVNRDPFPFLMAVEHLLQRPGVDPARVKVTFVGKCEYFKDRSLNEWLQDKRCRSVVTILPPVPAAEVAGFVADATVFLNLTQRAPLMVPAKTYDQIASGREILLICEDHSDAARTVEGIAGVTRVDPENQAGLNEALWDLYRRHAIEGSVAVPEAAQVAKFSRDTANRKFLEIMRGVARLDA